MGEPRICEIMFCILLTAVIVLGQWLIYTALLWIMIKLQRLNYNLLGLLGSSLLATGLDFIPVVGTYIGWAALIICLWKCTGADIAPDVLFTVAVAGALMFCVNLFFLAWVLTNLHIVSPLFSIAGVHEDLGDAIELVDDGDDSDADTAVNAKRVPTIETNTTNVVKPKAGIFFGAGRPKIAAQAEAAGSEAGVSPSRFTLKGISVNGARTSAMIANGREIHDVRAGESFAIQSDKGRVTVVCESITSTTVTLSANGSPIVLTLR